MNQETPLPSCWPIDYSLARDRLVEQHSGPSIEEYLSDVFDVLVLTAVLSPYKPLWLPNRVVSSD